jgi:hypothetical protein
MKMAITVLAILVSMVMGSAVTHAQAPRRLRGGARA